MEAGISPPQSAYIARSIIYAPFWHCACTRDSTDRKGSTVRLLFEQKLGNLKNRVLVMAGMAEQAIQRAVDAHQTRGLSVCDLVDYGERAIDRMEREIDEMAADLLATQQPLAHDLRFTLAVIKINGNLERVGNAAGSVSDYVRSLQTYP